MSDGQITPVRLDDAQGVVEFAPLPDITPQEAAMVAALMFRLVLWASPAHPEWRSYLVTYGLERHFRAM